jgi:PAS domain S-box-containing protein
LSVLQGPDDLDALRQRVAELEDTLRAISEGEIDAIVVQGQHSPTVYTLKSAAEPYRQIVEQMSEGALTVSSDGIILYCNAAFASMLKLSRERLSGTRLYNLVRHSSAERLKDLLSGSGSSHEMLFRAADSAPIHVHVSSARLVVEDAYIYCLVVTNLTGQELRLLHDTIVNSAPDAIFTLLLDGTIESWNPSAEKLYGYTAQKAIGGNVRMIIPPEKHAETQALLKRMAAGAVERVEVTRVSKNGALIDVLASWAPIHDAKGNVTSVVAVSQDITERKRSERQIQLLLQEFNHRAKNLLTVVQSIVRQTTKGAPGVIAERLNERIAALAASHDLLVQSNWTGVGMRELVSSHLPHWAELFDTRIVMEGPPLRLNAAAAQTMGMAFHELATNAAKYGALSLNEGRIGISWNTDNSNIKVRWAEDGGPPIAPPSRRGFGHMVLVNVVEQSLEAEVRLDYCSSGVVWEVIAPAERVLEPQGATLL